jgi:anti-sigma-K factor RskA
MTAPTEPDDHERHALAGEYVLGSLPHAERLRVEAQLNHDSALRAAVDAWERRLLPLTTMADPVTPPPALWQRIERSLAPAADAARGPAIGGWWNNLLLWRGLGVGGLAAAAIMAVVLAAPQSMKPGWVIEARDEGATRHLRLVPLGAVEVPAGKALQFWTKGDSWKGPVSLGLVTPGQPLEVALERLPKMEPNQLFEITLEPASGSPLGRPTGPILFIGRAVTI